MIFAAGLGTRLRPLTDSMPKALVCVGGQPLLWHVIMKLKKTGFQRIVVNVHHFAQQIIDYLDENNHFGLDIRISDERENLLDTGGGIKKALPLFHNDSAVLIHNVDILSNVDLAALYDQATHADAALLVSWRNTKRYLQFDSQMRLTGWKNIETGQLKGSEGKPLAFAGIHVLSPSTFPLFSDMPQRFGIIDFYLKHCDTCLFRGCTQEGLQLIDVGKLDTLSQAEKALARF